jgi:hypothetical protein
VSVSEHITADQGLFLLALTEDDPERTRAFAHAAECEACRTLLDESARALVLLDEGLAEVPALDPGLAARVHEALHAEKHAPWAWLGLALGAVMTLFLAWYSAHHTTSQAHHDGLRCFMFEQAFAAGAFGLGLVYAGQARGRVSNLQWATIAMSGAVAGQAFLLLRCNANGAALHILASHVLGVGCATLLGVLAGRLRSAS